MKDNPVIFLSPQEWLELRKAQLKILGGSIRLTNSNTRLLCSLDAICFGANVRLVPKRPGLTRDKVVDDNTRQAGATEVNGFVMVQSPGKNPNFTTSQQSWQIVDKPAEVDPSSNCTIS